jgi:PEP-utilizing family enzyme
MERIAKSLAAFRARRLPRAQPRQRRALHRPRPRLPGGQGDGAAGDRGGAQAGRKVGICGQAPSDYPEFAAFLVECGIDSMSLNPDAVLPTLRRLAAMEQSLEEERALSLVP